MNTANEYRETITVKELIEKLKQYPPDTIITYDYGLPIEIYKLSDGTLTIN